MVPTNNPAAAFRLKSEDFDLLLKLQEWEREIVLDRHQRGLSYETISLQRQTPVGTVKSRLHRSLTKLLQLRAQALEDKPVQNP